MPSFGLDNTILADFEANLSVEAVKLDQATDFFLLPYLFEIYDKVGDQLKSKLIAKLKAGQYAPKPPIELEVPKRRRVSSNSGSLIGPNYFRPGSVLLPEDRLVYHYIGQVAARLSDDHLDWTRVFSNKPSSVAGAGFVSSSSQWKALKDAFETEVKKDAHSVVLRCDLSQYFFSINQHELINQLEHQGMSPELKSFSEKFLSGLTLDRSSRGIVQGCYGSDVLGNSFLAGIDEHIEEAGFSHFRYVDDFYILFKDSDELKDYFPKFVKKLRDYDLSLNEDKSYISQPSRVLKEETELDKAIQKAKVEAKEKLTDYEEVTEIEIGPYGEETLTELLEIEPEDSEVELEATKEVFNKLDDFKGEERDRAEAFCLSLFRRASDPIAIPYVLRRWARQADKAKEYAIYLNRFVKDEAHRALMDKTFTETAPHMLDYQWAWAGTIMRRMDAMSPDLLTIASNAQKNPMVHDVVRSLLTYSVARHGSAGRKKEIRDAYPSSPLLVQLATIHASGNFVTAERNALLNTASGHGELQALLCLAMKK